MDLARPTTSFESLGGFGIARPGKRVYANRHMQIDSIHRVKLEIEKWIAENHEGDTLSTSDMAMIYGDIFSTEWLDSDACAVVERRMLRVGMPSVVDSGIAHMYMYAFIKATEYGEETEIRPVGCMVIADGKEIIPGKKTIMYRSDLDSLVMNVVGDSRSYYVYTIDKREEVKLKRDLIGEIEQGYPVELSFAELLAYANEEYLDKARSERKLYRFAGMVFEVLGKRKSSCSIKIKAVVDGGRLMWGEV